MYIERRALGPPVKQGRPHALVREQPRLLKDIACTAALGRHVDPRRRVEQRLAADAHMPPIRLEQPRDHVEHARLAHTRRAEQHRQSVARIEGGAYSSEEHTSKLQSLMRI